MSKRQLRECQAKCRNYKYQLDHTTVELVDLRQDKALAEARQAQAEVGRDAYKSALDSLGLRILHLSSGDDESYVNALTAVERQYAELLSEREDLRKELAGRGSAHKFDCIELLGEYRPREDWGWCIKQHREYEANASAVLQVVEDRRDELDQLLAAANNDLVDKRAMVEHLAHDKQELRDRLNTVSNTLSATNRSAKMANGNRDMYAGQVEGLQASLKSYKDLYKETRAVNLTMASELRTARAALPAPEAVRNLCDALCLDTDNLTEIIDAAVSALTDFVDQEVITIDLEAKLATANRQVKELENQLEECHEENNESHIETDRLAQEGSEKTLKILDLEEQLRSAIGGMSSVEDEFRDAMVTITEQDQIIVDLTAQNSATIHAQKLLKTANAHIDALVEAGPGGYVSIGGGHISLNGVHKSIGAWCNHLRALEERVTHPTGEVRRKAIRLLAPLTHQLQELHNVVGGTQVGSMLQRATDLRTLLKTS